MATLIAAPIIGAKEGGAAGFVKGVGAGVVGAVALPVAGVVVGTTQVVRGVANTPGAVKSKAQGKFWDKEKREWTVNDPKLQIVADTSAPADGADGTAVVVYIWWCTYGGDGSAAYMDMEVLLYMCGADILFLQSDARVVLYVLGCYATVPFSIICVMCFSFSLFVTHVTAVVYVCHRCRWWWWRS